MKDECEMIRHWSCKLDWQHKDKKMLATAIGHFIELRSPKLTFENTNNTIINCYKV